MHWKAFRMKFYKGSRYPVWPIAYITICESLNWKLCFMKFSMVCWNFENAVGYVYFSLSSKTLMFSSRR